MKYAQAPLVDRFVRKVRKPRREELNHWIDQQKTAIDLDRQPFIERHKRYLANWDDFVTYNRKGPWEESSNLHMPLTALMVKAYHSKLYSIFADKNTVQLLPREKYDEDLALALTKLRHWYLWDYINEFKGILGFVREITYDACTVGFGIGMKDWLFKQRKIFDIQPAQLIEEVSDMESKVSDEEPLDLEKEKVSTAQYKEVEKVLTIYEGSRLKTVPFENIYFPNDIPESNDLDYPSCVVVETEIPLSEIKLKMEQGEWDDKAWDQIKNAKSEVITQNNLGTGIKDIRASLTGYHNTNTDNSNRIVQYAFCSYDVDEDGIAEELVVIRTAKGDLLKIVDLDRISRTGKRPLFKFDCFSKPRQAYSRGVPEFLFPLNEEMDITHNAKTDYMMLQNCPFGAYRSTSSLKNEEIRIAPGKFMPVDEITDIKVLNFSGNAQIMSGEEDRLWQYAERLVSVSSINQGMVPDKVGPLRSTSGVQELLRQMDKEFRVTIDQMSQQWRKLEVMLLDDLDFRIPMDVKLRVLGAEVKDSIERAYGNDERVNQILRINSQFDTVIDVANLVRSDELKRSESELILNKLSAPSLLQQFGVVNPNTLYKATCEYLKAWGKKAEDYVVEPQYIQTALTLFQEIQICGQGELPPMAMQDDHMTKAQMLVQFMQQPEYQEAKAKGLYVDKADEMILRAAQKHLVLQEMLQPQGLPNPQGANEQNPNMIASGVAPQPGGTDANKTTSRELAPPKEENGPEAGAEA